MATVLSPAFAADPTGDWKDEDGFASIRVAQCNGNMWGATSWEKTPGGTDKNNPDAAKQSRPTLGMPILIDMKKKAGVDTWEGQIYNPKDGQLYNASIKPIGSDKLEVQGCVLGFLCGGQTWTRVGPPIPLSVAGNPAAKGAAPKASAPSAPQAAQQAPKTTGAVPPAATKPGQKQATAAASPDVGDICLLPDIARPTR